MGLGQDVLRHLEARRTQRGHISRATTLHGPALRQYLARKRHFLGKCSRPDREPLAPFARRAQINMNKAGPRIEPKLQETDSPRRRLKRNGIVVRHGDVERRTIHVL